MYKNLLLLSCFLFSITISSAFNINSRNNLVGFWGQNSASAGGKPYQTQLIDYCDKYDVLNIAFLVKFFGDDTLKSNSSIKLPALNLANLCWNFFPDYPHLMTCPEVGTGVTSCQSKNKIVILSLGGDSAGYGFASNAEAEQFANTLWNMFFEGTDTNYPRPFGSAILDGVDLDLENRIGTQYYGAFVTKFNQLALSGTKKYYITADPQCVFPDASIGPSAGSALSTGLLDFISIQFYNNACGLNSGSAFNYNTWENWILSNSPKTKIFVGAPADTYGAGSGYISERQLEILIQPLMSKQSFGGVMLWDASIAEANIVNATAGTYSNAISTFMKMINPTPTSTTSGTTSSPTSTTSSPTSTTSKPTSTTGKPTTTTGTTTTPATTTGTTKTPTTTTSTTRTPTSTSGTTSTPTTTTDAPTTSTTSTTSDSTSSTTGDSSTTTTSSTTGGEVPSDANSILYPTALFIFFIIINTLI
ncbi:hypothetical protein PPL_09532 [Heterostelium album PN500]|uniref:chitinase n=1 Tax=Heterostelium pallidum (strain ATCC 26659 / Pp 5 / PN500) TaxID=670386 RepID=D3BNC1_HETP5|nr:hypothetical protein PPL_09532 [Heterostelium album PN500]EFA76781.1 hypothetical protein PPL_09532 [Heterostelium album PN500]|eukprot:XP_020428913.1 hypothetical protein PPL_09532 [Heterostelium album PN500]